MLLALVALLGCAPAEATEGELGVARLRYVDAWRSCSEACTLEVPLAVGGTAFLQLFDGGAVGALRSADPDIVRVEAPWSEEHMRIIGVSEGATTLEVVRDGEVVDRFPIEARHVREVEGLFASTVRVGVIPALARLRYRDAEGQALRGLRPLSYAVTDGFMVGDGSLARVSADVMRPGGGWPTPRVFDELEVSSDQSGRAGELVLTAPDGDRWAVPLFAAEPVIEEITLSATVSGPDARIEAALRYVNGREGVRACCDWRVESPDGGVGLNGASCAEVRAFNAMPTEAHDARVICAARGVEEAIDVRVYPDPNP